MRNDRVDYEKEKSSRPVYDCYTDFGIGESEMATVLLSEAATAREGVAYMTVLALYRYFTYGEESNLIRVSIKAKQN